MPQPLTSIENARAIVTPFARIDSSTARRQVTSPKWPAPSCEALGAFTFEHGGEQYTVHNGPLFAELLTIECAFARKEPLAAGERIDAILASWKGPDRLVFLRITSRGHDEHH
ncbi:MAG: hypothetical protein GY711_15775 [bacterium]|nr:hypothetical protein [bacterium]